jgi:hypothetical protein
MNDDRERDDIPGKVAGKTSRYRSSSDSYSANELDLRQFRWTPPAILAGAFPQSRVAVNLPLPVRQSEDRLTGCAAGWLAAPARGAVGYSAASRDAYPIRPFSSAMSFSAASAITVPGGKMAEVPAAWRASKSCGGTTPPTTIMMSGRP